MANETCPDCGCLIVSKRAHRKYCSAKHGRALLERLEAAEAVTKQAMRLRAAWIHHDEGPVLKDLIVAWERTVWRNPEA